MFDSGLTWHVTSSSQTIETETLKFNPVPLYCDWEYRAMEDGQKRIPYFIKKCVPSIKGSPIAKLKY
jgi:hypothetical protein